MGFRNFFENPIGTIESWGEDIYSKGRDFVGDLAHGNIGGALGNLAALATNLTPIGAAMNAFTGGGLEDGVFKTVDGVTHGRLHEALGGLVEGIFSANPSLVLVNDILDGKPIRWADHLLGVDPETNTTVDVEWPGRAPARLEPSEATRAAYERVGRALTAISNQHNNGGPVVRLPAFASRFLLLSSQKDSSQFPNQSDCQWHRAFNPPAQKPSLWSVEDTLQVAGMLAFAIPEAGAIVSGGVSALSLLRRNLENQEPKVDPMLEYLGRSISSLQQFVDRELKESQIQEAVSFFRGKQTSVLQPFADAIKGGAALPKDILSECKGMLDKGEDALSALMYDYRPIGALAVPPTVAEYAFRAWIDCANTFLFCMKAGCILTAVEDEDWSDLSGALKKKKLTERIASNPGAYAYYQKINALLGTSTSPFRRHLQLTLISMHQKLAARLQLLELSVGDANLLRYQPAWRVAVDGGLQAARGGHGAQPVDDFIVSHVNWPRLASEPADHLVRGATKASPPEVVWQRSGAFAVGDPDTLTKNTYAYAAMILNHYVDAFNYDVGGADAPNSMLNLAVSVAEKWWVDERSLWQSLTRSLATYQLHAQKNGGAMPFWDALQVPTKEDVRALLAAYVSTVQSSRDAGASGLSNAGRTAQADARGIAGRYGWGG
jgi:hypothetical protein